MLKRVVVLALLLCVACAPSNSSDEPVLPAQSEAPPPQEPVMMRFAVIGDWGSGFDQQYDLGRRMCDWRENHLFDMVVTTGDNIYEAGEPEHFDSKFFEPYACLLDNGVRFRAVLGNHDIGTNNGEPELNEPAFGMKNRNYVVRRHGVRFVLWESNYSRKRWLRRHLGEESGDRWTVVSFHHPIFSPGPHGGHPPYTPDLPRMFRRKGVDLVLNGHDHLYALMPEKRKIRYVVTGGGGASLYACENPEVAEICLSRHHFLYVRVYETQIRVQAVPISGRPFDTFIAEGRD